MRKRVELALIHARGHHEVAGAFGSRLDQHRCLHLDEPLPVQVVSRFGGYTGAQQQRLFHRVTADVEVAVFHPEVVASVGMVFDRKRGCDRAIEDFEFAHDDLNIAGCHLRVLVLPFGNLPAHLQDEFTTQLSGSLAERCVLFHVEHQLGNAITVAQVDERHPAQITGSLQPSGQGNGLPDRFQVELSAGVGT